MTPWEFYISFWMTYWEFFTTPKDQLEYLKRDLNFQKEKIERIEEIIYGGY